jgi:hypothetical protein
MKGSTYIDRALKFKKKKLMIEGGVSLPNPNFLRSRPPRVSLSLSRKQMPPILPRSSLSAEFELNPTKQRIAFWTLKKKNHFAPPKNLNS